MSKIIKHRNRRTAYEQLSAVEFAVESIIESKGKHRRQFDLMDGNLQNYFRTLHQLLGAINSHYECFLYDEAIHNEKKAERFLPDVLKEKLPLIKQARDNALV